MSEPKIYTLNHIHGAFKIYHHWMCQQDNRMTPAPAGDYVRYEDYARLKAEVDRLEKTVTHLNNTLNQYALDDWRMKDEVTRLKAEVETLKENPMIVSLLTHLRVENARLKAEVERMTNTSTNADKFLISGLEQDVAILQAQVERLTKAGDALKASIICGTLSEEWQAIDEWETAKEGKQP